MKFDLHELEPLIIVHCLKDRLFFLKIKDHIKEDYFINTNLSKIFAVTKKYYDKYTNIPNKETLKVLFKKQYNEKAENYLTLIDEIYNYNQNYDDKFIIHETTHFVKQAKIIEAIKESYPYLEEPDKFHQIAEKINNAISINFDKDLGLKFTSDAVESVTEEVSAKLSTGYAQLDEIMNGGVEPETLSVFSGVYGTGKSIWLHNIATRQLLLNRNVILYTLELSEKQVMKRLVSSFAKINQNDFLERKPELIQQFEELKKMSSGEIWIKRYPTGTASIVDFKLHINDIITTENKKPDIIIVDYANIMCSKNDKGNENSYDRVKRIYEELRSLAQEFKIPILTAAQVNRGGVDEKKGGTKSGQLITGANTAESMGINFTVDFHAVINQTAEDRVNNIIKLFYDKNRFGKTGGLGIFNINYDYLSIDDAIIS